MNAEIERRHFVIVASQRTGSTLLVRSLDSSPSIFCAGEIFHPGPRVHHAEFRFPYASAREFGLKRLLGYVMQGKRVENHLRMFYECAGVDAKAVGFKLMTTQTRALPGIVSSLQEMQAKFLFLYRQDSFATALSYYKARESSVFHSGRSNAEIASRAIVAEEGEFLRLLDDCRSHKERILRLYEACGGCLLTYESMASHWDQFIAGIGEAIGVRNLKVSMAIPKLRTGIDTVRVLNEDNLRERFAER